MPEAEYRSVPVVVKYLCDTCGEEMVHSGAPSVILFTHRCANGHVQDLPQLYPSVRHVVIGERLQ